MECCTDGAGGARPGGKGMPIDAPGWPAPGGDGGLRVGAAMASEDLRRTDPSEAVRGMSGPGAMGASRTGGGGR